MNKLFILFFFIITNNYAQNSSLIDDYKYKGAPFYPEQLLTEKDSLKWPINFEISIDVKDIKGLDLNSTSFFVKCSLVHTQTMLPRLLPAQKILFHYCIANFLKSMSKKII